MVALEQRNMFGNRTAGTSDESPLDVLLPVARQQKSRAMIERLEGTFRLNVQPHHAIWMIFLFVLAVGSAQAQAPKDLISPIDALVKWMPFILWGPEGELSGFSLNIIISFFAMLFGTVAGIALQIRITRKYRDATSNEEEHAT